MYKNGWQIERKITMNSFGMHGTPPFQDLFPLSLFWWRCWRAHSHVSPKIHSCFNWVDLLYVVYDIFSLINSGFSFYLSPILHTFLNPLLKKKHLCNCGILHFQTACWGGEQSERFWRGCVYCRMSPPLGWTPKPGDSYGTASWVSSKRDVQSSSHHTGAESLFIYWFEGFARQDGVQIMWLLTRDSRSTDLSIKLMGAVNIVIITDWSWTEVERYCF